jgi:predicted secreted protein
MGVLTAIAYYVLFWWVCLFAVLSIGLKTQDEEGEIVPGTEPSAPAKLRIGRSLLINTVVSGLLFGAWYYATQVMGMGLHSFPSIYPDNFNT